MYETSKLIVHQPMLRPISLRVSAIERTQHMGEYKSIQMLVQVNVYISGI